MYECSHLVMLALQRGHILVGLSNNVFMYSQACSLSYLLNFFSSLPDWRLSIEQRREIYKAPHCEAQMLLATNLHICMYLIRAGKVRFRTKSS